MIVIKSHIIFFLVIILFLFGSCKNDPIIPDSNYYSKNDCDTTSVTYTNFVNPFATEKNCVLCHSNDLGYIPYLDVYDSITNYLQDTAKENIFMEKISTNHKILDSSNFNTECEISKFRSWIRIGKP